MLVQYARRCDIFGEVAEQRAALESTHDTIPEWTARGLLGSVTRVLYTLDDSLLKTAATRCSNPQKQQRTLSGRGHERRS